MFPLRFIPAELELKIRKGSATKVRNGSQEAKLMGYRFFILRAEMLVKALDGDEVLALKESIS